MFDFWKRKHFEYDNLTSAVELTPEDLKVTTEKQAQNMAYQIEIVLNRFRTEKQSHGNYDILSHSA